MKKIIVTVTIAMGILIQEIKAQSVGIGTVLPDASAQLDITSNTKGVLIPRMTKTERQGIASPANGLLVYQSAPDSTGFYYYTGTGWQYLFTSNNASSNVWKTTGNAATDSAIHFFGTTDLKPIMLRYNDIWAGIINPRLSNYAIGKAAGQQLLSSDNIAFGDSALALATGSNNNYNIAFGSKALKKGTNNSNRNTAIGHFALGNNTEGGENIAIGFESQNNSIKGAYNVSLGDYSLYSLDSGSLNTAVGQQAMQSSRYSANNAAFGYSALYSDTSGNNNTAIGALSMLLHKNGSLNTALGYNTLRNGISVISCVAIGANAAFSNQSNYTTAVGALALQNNNSGGSNPLTEGIQNTAVGYSALYSNTTGIKNTAVGFSALNGTGISSGSFNTAIGANTIQSLITGNNNTALGADALANAASSFNNIAIGDSSMALTNFSDNNIGIGSKALKNNTSGTGRNIALGNEALTNNNSGSENIAIGYQSLTSNGAGFGNSAVGSASLGNNLSGNFNTAIGYNSMFGVTGQSTGNFNTALGAYSLRFNKTGASNVALGHFALQQNGSGSANIAIGPSAKNANTTGSDNIAIGSSADVLDSTGNYNIAIGSASLQSNRNRSKNVAVGVGALQNTGSTVLPTDLTQGLENTAIGYAAMGTNTTGYRNTAIGASSFNNFSLGGNNNTVVGYGADISLGNISNATAIGSNATVGISNAVVLGSSAKVGIGTSTPGQKLEVVAENSILNAGHFISSFPTSYLSNGATVLAENTLTISTDVAAVMGTATQTPSGYGYGGYFRSRYVGVYGETITGVATNISTYGVWGKAYQTGGTGTNFGVYGDAANASTNYGVYCNGNGGYTGTWSLVSDAMFKKNISSFSTVLHLINQLKPVNYLLKQDEYPNMNFPSGTQYGFVAQELEKVFPTLVENGSHPGITKEAGDIKYKAVNYIGLIPVLTKAIQEQQATIDDLNRKLQNQQSQIDDLIKLIKGK